MIPTPRRFAFANESAYTGLPGRAAAHETPVRVPGCWYDFCSVVETGITSGNLPPVNQTIWQIAVVPLRGTFDRLVVRHTAGAAGAAAWIALYLASKANPLDSQEKADGWPTGSPIVSTGILACVGAGESVYVFPAPLAFAAGQILWLWIARANAATPTVTRYMGYAVPMNAAFDVPAGGSLLRVGLTQTTGRIATDPPPNLGAAPYNLWTALPVTAASLGYSVGFRLQP
jgi:hypothetical protein